MLKSWQIPERERRAPFSVFYQQQVQGPVFPGSLTSHLLHPAPADPWALQSIATCWTACRAGSMPWHGQTGDSTTTPPDSCHRAGTRGPRQKMLISNGKSPFTYE